MDFGMSVLRYREMERKRLKYASAMIQADGHTGSSLPR